MTRFLLPAFALTATPVLAHSGTALHLHSETGLWVAGGIALMTLGLIGRGVALQRSKAQTNTRNTPRGRS